MNEGKCSACGQPADDMAIVITSVTFAPGRRGPRTYRELPERLEDWRVCWGCLSGDGGLLVRQMLVDEYLEPVFPDAGEAGECVVSCRGSWSMVPAWRRFWSPFQGRRGLPAGARCPVCWGPVELERAGE